MSTTIIPAGQTSTLALEEEDILKVSNGGTAFQCTALTGGQIICSAGGNVNECTVSGVVPEGMTDISSGMIVLSGGNGSGNTVLSGGAEHISSGGVEIDGDIYGLLVVSSAGSANAPRIFNGGVATVLAGGLVGNPDIKDGGIMRLQGDAVSKGQADYATVRQNGLLEVLNGGKAFSASVYGQMTVFELASANSTTVYNGGQMVVSSGAVAYYTTISAGGRMTLISGGSVGSATHISGGVLLAEKLVVSSPEVTGYPRGQVLISNGGLVSATTMSIQSGANVSIDTESILRFQTLTKHTKGTFEVANIESYDPQTGTCRRLLDCTATGESVWTENKYKTLLGLTPEVFSNAFVFSGGDLYLRGTATVSAGGDGDKAFATIESALALNPNGLVILDGDYTLTENRPTFNGVATVVSGGSFATSVCGGVFVSEGGAPVNIGSTGAKQNISMVISGGTFDKNVFAGDRVNDAACLTRTGDTSMTIAGGTFRKAVAGGLALTTNLPGADAILDGNVFLTIKGGTFQNTVSNSNKEWIYGGCIASSKTLCVHTVITGNVTVTLDSSERDLNIMNLVAGSYGDGWIEGDVSLVVTGTESIIAAGEIWGGCSGDIYSSLGYYDTSVVKDKGTENQVFGKRTLSFTGFTGELKCDKIRAFNYAGFVRNGTAVTSATLNSYTPDGGLDMRFVENWTFENGCSLSGSFANDFAGDTLNLTGLTLGNTVADWEILANSHADGFLNFNGLKVQVNGSDVGTVSDNRLTWTWEPPSTSSASAVKYTLALAFDSSKDSYVLSFNGVIA